MTFSKKTSAASIYGGADPRLLPAYPFVEAAHYLGVKPSTLSSWFRGRSAPLRLAADVEQLSFVNFVEAFVLKGLREKHRLSMQQVRRDIDQLREQFPDLLYPLADIDLRVTGRDLYADRGGQLIDATRGGQLGIRSILALYLERVDRSMGGAVRLYPFTRAREETSPRAIVIDPTVSFGRPVISGTSIPTAALHDRWKAATPSVHWLRTTTVPSKKSKKQSATKPPEDEVSFVDASMGRGLARLKDEGVSP